MGKAKPRNRQCRLNAQIRKRQTQERLEAKRFAYSIIVTGSETTKALDLFAWNDIHIPFSKSELYRQLVFICDAIKKWAEESMNTAFMNMQPNTVISFDGSWEHRRNSHRCLTCVIDQSTQKVIMASIKNSKISMDSPDFCKIPQNMEVESIKTMIPKLRLNQNIIGYVHDNDAKTRKAIFNANWNICEYLDPGHAMKSFDRAIMKVNALHNNVLKEIEVSLRKFMKYLLKNSSNRYTKIQWWLNSAAHFCGDHSKCPFQHKQTKIWTLSNNSEAIQILLDFLNNTKYIIEHCYALYSTQTNEAFHKIKLKYATKDIKWGFTWQARMYAAILDKNELFWKMNLYEHLGMRPLSVHNQIFLRNKEKYRYYHKVIRRSEKFLQKQNQYRQSIKANQQNNQVLLYRPNPYINT